MTCKVMRRFRFPAFVFALCAMLGFAACSKGCNKGGTGSEITTPDGLKIEVLSEGDGDVANKGNLLTVHYTGWLKDGTKFDSSKDRDRPFKFTLGAGQVIRGWDQGLEGMKVGGKRKLEIPPEMGYGTRGAGTAIPPNSTLVFEVELLAVN